MPPTCYRGCWHVVSRDLFLRYRPSSSLRKVLYNPKAFIAHAALLHQAFAHCAIFPTAATRRCLDRVSVPVWGATLSGPLPVCLGRPLPYQLADGTQAPLEVDYSFRRRFLETTTTWGISSSFPELSPASRQVTNALLTRSPLGNPIHEYEYTYQGSSFDLHVLGTPPAFILSQDQTLRIKNFVTPEGV